VSLPTGTVTFLFTDLERSTQLWEQHSDAMRNALARHDEILRSVVEMHDGHVVKTTGDGLHAAFTTALDALTAAVDAQRALTAERWAPPDPLRIRMGVHTGEADVRDLDYYGPAVNRAARVSAAAQGGQILLSAATVELVRDSLPADVSLLDLGEHALRGLARGEHLFQVVATGLRRDFPPLASIDRPPTNLPLAVTSFVGRDDEVAEIARALERDRVVTLTGVGGVGKTRLAVHVAEEVLPRFPDGAWLCELGPVSDGNAVADVLATALALQTRAGATALETVVDGLRHRNLLIVLDNCEHVIGPAAQMVDAIVRSCDGVRILATSREGLGTSGERLILIRSLGLPDHAARDHDAPGSAAVRLFADRAAAATRNFELSDENLAPVVQICRRLDGIPLAIELAAARTRLLSPTEIADRLDERFRLLTGGRRTAVERHQTLRAAVDWSYDLLEPSQRELLDRLGVFAGGFTLEGAAWVHGDVGVDMTLDELGQLVDKSLVLAEETGDGSTRYRLLETIRQYAVAHLDETGITDSVRRRHAEWFAEFVAEASARCRGPEEPLWAQRIGRETENLRAAVTWATGADETQLAMALLGRLEIAQWPNSPMLYALGPWAANALETPNALEDPNAGLVLSLRAADHLLHGRVEAAERDAIDAIERVMRPGARFSPYPWSVLLRGYALSGRDAAIRSRYEGVVDAARERGDAHQIAFAYCLSGMTLVVANRVAEAAPFAEEALSRALEVGAPSVIAFASTVAALVADQQDPRRATELAEMSLDHALRSEHGLNLMTSLNALGRLAQGARDPVWASRYRELLDQTYEAGDARLVLSLLESYAQALVAVDEFELAAKLLGLDDPLLPTRPLARVRIDRTREQLLAALGTERLETFTREGAGLSIDAAVDLVRAELDRVIDGAAQGR
jgi:predicted ATPase/class 3 adenylate cyclase